MKISKIHIIFSILIGAVSCLGSCREINEDEPEKETSHIFCLSTKGEDDSTNTYRLIFYGNSRKYYGCGTYRTDGTSGATLQPCRLNDDGTIQEASEEDHANAYIQPSAGSYQVVCVSPGVKCESDGGIGLLSNSERIKMTESEAMTIYGYGHHAIKNLLKEPRSRIILKFLKDSRLQDTDVSISDVRLYGAGNGADTVKFYPATKQLVTDRHKYIDVPLKTDASAPSGVDANMPLYQSQEPVYVISSIYAPKEIVKSKLSGVSAPYQDTDYLMLTFDLKYGDHEAAPINIAVSQQYPVLKPQYEYTYEIIVQSEYISVFITIHSCGMHEWGWHPEYMDDQTVGGDPDTVTVEAGRWKLSGGGWEEENLPNQTIE